MTTQVNRPLTNAENLFKTIVWDPLIMMGETALFAAVPALNAPIIGTLDKKIISGLSDFFFQQLIQFVDVTAIKFLNSAHETAYQDACLKLNIIIQSQGINSDAFIKARDIEIAAFVAAVRFNT